VFSRLTTETVDNIARRAVFKPLLPSGQIVDWAAAFEEILGRWRRFVTISHSLGWEHSQRPGRMRSCWPCLV
jgi:hypothetical protein